MPLFLRTPSSNEAVIRQMLRATRSNPPGLATNDAPRRATFQAAMEQAEQLLDAAAMTPYAARPLPLFYALSQGGRAVSAAHGANATLSGHGLSFGQAGQSVLHQTVAPTGGPATSFAGVAQATGSPGLTDSIEIGAAWSAIPELRITQPPGEHWPHSLYLQWLNSDPLTISNLVKVRIIGLKGDGGNLPGVDDIRTELANYPKANDLVVGPEEGRLVIAHPAPFGEGFAGYATAQIAGHTVEDRLAKLDEFAPEHRWREFRSLIPSVGRGGDALSPLMLWWVLLYGLSMYARYAPDAWTTALNVDASELAVPLESVLDSALDAVPHLLLDAIKNDPQILQDD